MTPLTNGYFRTRELRLRNVRGWLPVLSVPLGESTIFLKNLFVRRTVASVTRSRAVE